MLALVTAFVVGQGAEPPSYQMQHLGKWAPHLIWVASSMAESAGKYDHGRSGPAPLLLYGGVGRWERWP